MTGPGDPTRYSRLRPMRLLLDAMNADIARLYDEAEIEGVKTSFVMELIRLHEAGPMTITALAESVQRTHSALSQKVAAMRRAGLVTTAKGSDGRSREITLTPKAEAVIDRLKAEWRATEAAMAELEAEIPYPLSRVIADMAAALEQRSFHDRISAHLRHDPNWPNP